MIINKLGRSVDKKKLRQILKVKLSKFNFVSLLLYRFRNFHKYKKTLHKKQHISNKYLSNSIKYMVKGILQF